MIKKMKNNKKKVLKFKCNCGFQTDDWDKFKEHLKENNN